MARDRYPRARRGRRRVQIKDILQDPEQRRELMIQTLIATQAREGVITTREQAERAYDKILRELHQEQLHSNPGAPPTMHRNDAKSMAGAMQTFKRFHSREPGSGVYPFHKREQGVFELPEYVEWPDCPIEAGNAARTLYESDKWAQTRRHGAVLPRPRQWCEVRGVR